MTRDDAPGSVVGRALRWLTTTPDQDHDDWLDPEDTDDPDSPAALRSRIKALEAELAEVREAP
ncbi:hypothetical protein [Spirillospora sp. NPDC047279]|uniref:hypothetical protein n=1 Tax=Spirillospora sp. NPDC047279 TaxID=3155478 RepID=UPI003400B1D1